MQSFSYKKLFCLHMNETNFHNFHHLQIKSTKNIITEERITHSAADNMTMRVAWIFLYSMTLMRHLYYFALLQGQDFFSITKGYLNLTALSGRSIHIMRSISVLLKKKP